MEDMIHRRLEKSVTTIKNLDVYQIMKIAEILIDGFKNKKQIYLFGNGGSAADAQHLATELCGKYKLDRNPLPAIALSANIATVTAIANDYSYDEIFVRQLEALAKQGDIAIGISTSGNSVNVIKAIETAHKLGLVTVGFTGCVNKLKDLVQFPLIVPSDDVPHIQEGYMTAGHIICELIENSIFIEKSIYR